MTPGELRFYLREIHSFWTTPRITREKIDELHQAQLVELSQDPVPVIRLTNAGAKAKLVAGQRKSNSSLNLVNRAQRSNAKRTRPRFQKPRPWS